MQQRADEHQCRRGREQGSLSPAPTSGRATAKPRDALHESDERQRCEHVAHRWHRSPIAWVWVCVGITLGLPALAWASEGGTTELSVGLAVLLGAVQGATEFLPVSSSGHLSVGQAWLGIDPETAGHRFNIVLHAGTLLAVLWVYRKDVVALLAVLIRPTEDTPTRRRLLMMLLASLPLGIALVPAVEGAIVAMESNVRLVGFAFWATALILFLAFRGGRGEPTQTEEPPSPRQAILIGLAQVCAILPGISRSGSTIAAGLAVGLDRGQAARFSFLISLIAVGGATAKEALDVFSMEDPGAIAVVPFAAGFVASLAVGLASLRGLLYLVSKGEVRGFVIYLVLLGGVAVALG